MRPHVGLRVNMPQKSAGILRLPPMSLPIPMIEPPPPIRAPSPVDDPPGVRLQSRGLKVVPYKGLVQS